MSNETAPVWSEEMFRALTLNSSDIVSLLDRDGRLLYNSPAAARISGFSAAELEGRDTFELIHPEDREAVRKVFESVVSRPGATGIVQYRYRTRAGGWTWMEAVACNQLDNPEVHGIVANSRDITERRRADDERAQLEAQLTHRQRLEGLGTLAGGIAHDFNNLLSALSAHVSLAQSASTQSEVREELEFAHEAIKRATELTRQLLGFARRQPVRSTTFDLCLALDRLLPLLQRLLGGQIRVGLTAPSTPVWVNMDPSQLEQVVVNLATNARDAMPDGGKLELSLRTAPREGREPPEGAAVLRVTDTGGGIAPDVLPRVLEPFFTTKDPGHGTGLGLAVSHGIVTHVGGSIALESQVGRGTSVILRLPLAPPPARETTAVSTPVPTELARPGERLLLADDDDHVRAATRRQLNRLGWQVDEARDGQEVVNLVTVTPKAWAAIVMDLRMPGLGGAAAARRVAELAPSLPILFISGYSDDVELPAEVLQKPVDGSVLATRVREAIDRSRR